MGLILPAVSTVKNFYQDVTWRGNIFGLSGFLKPGLLLSGSKAYSYLLIKSVSF